MEREDESLDAMARHMAPCRHRQRGELCHRTTRSRVLGDRVFFWERERETHCSCIQKEVVCCEPRRFSRER